MSPKIDKSSKKPKIQKFKYSKKYYDDDFEYRHIKLPETVLKQIPEPPILLSETDMKNIGLNLSTGWINYLRHKPEPHIILVRRHLTCNVKLNRSMNPKNYPTLQEIYSEGDKMFEEDE